MPCVHYRLSGPEDVFLEQLSTTFAFIPEPAAAFNLIYFDTFDWRLHGACLQLLQEQTGEQTCLRLLHAAEGALATMEMTVMPNFAWDFPAGPVRDVLGPVMEMRSLLSVAHLYVKRTGYRLLDEREKTVVRLEILFPCVQFDDESVQPLLPRVLVHPLKGFSQEARALCTFMAKRVGLTPLENDLFAEALSARGRTPGDYTSKINLTLDPGQPAAEALRLVLGRLLDTLLANQKGVERHLDSEFLHDFRVAVRRTRSALGQLKGVFPAREVEHFRREFAWLGAITSPARDLDVYLLHFPDFQASLPPEVHDDLLPFREFLAKHLQSEYRQLVKHLRGARFRKLVSRWRDFIEAPGDIENTPLGAQPLNEVAGARIWKVYRRVVREGHAINRLSPSTDLHELRKTCKKLRYLMEFFQSLYPAAAIGRLIKALKGLQDYLGAYQDLHVQVETLRRFSHEMSEEGNAPAQTLLALGRLVEGLDQRQTLVRDEFDQSFARFAREKNQLLFRELFKPQTRGPA